MAATPMPHKLSAPRSTMQYLHQGFKGGADPRRSTPSTTPQLNRSSNSPSKDREDPAGGASSRPDQVGMTDDPRYCVYHRNISHPTANCWALKERLETLVQADVLTLEP